MKKLVFIFTAILFFSCSKNEFHKMTPSPIIFGENYCEIKLTYDVDKDTQYIFSPDTTVALDIMDVTADGNTLDMVQDEPFNVSECPLKIIKEFSKNDCYITLHLKGFHTDKYYLWNDGRGILFNQGENDVMYPYTNSYLIPRNPNKLIIRYRVLLPSSGIDYSFLYKSKDNTGRYTKTYIANISLSDITVDIREE